uniref:Putative secreted protein n=1 Tax=Anopheles triannulatus TaxID=58253 RepID=A0A2M4B3B2_9DIPT
MRLAILLHAALGGSLDGLEFSFVFQPLSFQVKISKTSPHCPSHSHVEARRNCGGNACVCGLFCVKRTQWLTRISHSHHYLTIHSTSKLSPVVAASPLCEMNHKCFFFP